MNAKKIIGLSLFSVLLLSACNQEKHPLEDFAVNKDDLKKEEIIQEPTKSQEVLAMESHNEKQKQKALTEYQNSIEVIEYNEDAASLYDKEGNLIEDVPKLQKLDNFNKWDAMMIVDILNEYELYFKEKTLLTKELKENGSFNGEFYYENQDLNETIVDIDELFMELNSDEFNSYYEDLKKLQGLIKVMIYKEEEHFDLNHFNMVKSQYEQRKLQFLRSVGLNKLVPSEHFRISNE